MMKRGGSARVRLAGGGGRGGEGMVLPGLAPVLWPRLVRSRREEWWQRALYRRPTAASQLWQLQVGPPTRPSVETIPAILLSSPDERLAPGASDRLDGLYR